MQHWQIAWIFIPLTGAAVSWLSARALIRFAPLFGFTDAPGRHKFHSAPTPLLGGLGLFTGILVCLAANLLSQGCSLAFTFFFLTAAIPALLLGILDDRFIFSPLPKLIGFCCIACFPAAWLAVFTSAHLFNALIFALLLFFFTNALNLLDNVDGLCSSIGLAILLTSGLYYHSPVIFALAACLAGFLFTNWPPARIFLGDTGSLLVGVLCVFAVFYPFHVPASPWKISPLLAVPVYDTFSVIFVRLSQGRSILQGGQDHLSHRLIRSGFSVQRVNIVLSAVTFLAGAAAIYSPQHYTLPIGLASLLLIGCIEYLARRFHFSSLRH